MLGVKCDVTNPSEIQVTVDKAVKAFGGLITLVNNVGRGEVNSDPLGVSNDKMIDSYTLNTLSALRMIEACAPHLQKAKNASMTNSSSMVALPPAFEFIAYRLTRAEITAHYPEQLQRLEVALSSQVLEETRVTDLAEVQLFAELTTKELGIGECSAFAVAVHRQHWLAIDDKKAIKKVASLGYNLNVLDTESLMMMLIR